VTEILQNLADGLGAGSTYALFAVGVSLIFGVMHLVNFAHGELLTLGAYLAYWMLLREFGWWVVVPAVIGAAVLGSMSIEFVAFRRIRGANPFTLLLTSFALEVLSHAVWKVFVSSKRKPFATPEWAFESFAIGSVRFEWWNIVAFGVAVLSFAVTAFVLRRTMFGLAVRAAAEDFDAARLMGVKANRVISGAFAFAGLLAGIASSLILMRKGGAEPRMGADPLLKAVIAAVIGGLGSLPGAVAGGLALGVTEVFVRDLLPEDLGGLTDGLVFAVIALLFIVRPQGLFNVETAERV
jgi:branched-chain amino acid transport system permease protein